MLIFFRWFRNLGDRWSWKIRTFCEQSLKCLLFWQWCLIALTIFSKSSCWLRLVRNYQKTKSRSSVFGLVVHLFFQVRKIFGDFVQWLFYIQVEDQSENAHKLSLISLEQNYAFITNWHRCITFCLGYTFPSSTMWKFLKQILTLLST